MKYDILFTKSFDWENYNHSNVTKLQFSGHMTVDIVNYSSTTWRVILSPIPDIHSNCM